MILWRKDDLEVHNHGSWKPATSWDAILNYNSKRSARKLLALEKFTNCWPGQDEMMKEMHLGILMDDGFIEASGGEDEAKAFAAEIVADTNSLYRRQMDVQFKIGKIEYGEVEGFTFNEKPARSGTKTCPSGDDAEQRLYKLEAWRRTYRPNEMGLWHLLTDCHPPPGTVGIAFVGVICQISAGVGLS